MKMFTVGFYAVLFFVAAESAVIAVDNFENEVNRIEGWASANADKAGKIVKEEASLLKVWATKELDEAKILKTEIVNDIDRHMHAKLTDTCVCYHRTCGCCIHAEEPDIHLNSTVCVNVTYLSEDYGISFTVTLNNHTLYNETVSVKNPPPVCVGFPYVKELADICVRLYDIEAKSHTFHACARLEARMKTVLIAHYDLGCFSIGSTAVKNSKKANYLGNSPSVVLV